MSTSPLPSARLLRGQQIALAKLCQEFVSAGWVLLAEHAEQIPREQVLDLRKALTIIRRIHEDCNA